MSRRKLMKPKAASKSTPAKDNSQFLEALKLYEDKNYKKSVKLLDALLKKDSRNPDTLSLKAMDLLFLGEKKEAEGLVGQAIKLIDGTKASAICCHVLGIYMRTTKDYKESIKWFQASLENGSTNNQIYRDLATLQSQIGDFKAALVSRKKYWEVYLGYRANWTSLAIAQDINGERQQAINTLSQFEKLAEGKISDAEKFEHSECLFYKNDIMYRQADTNAEKLQKVLNHLQDIEGKVSDKFGILERRASCLMKMGKFRDASIVYRTLIKRNPDNFVYYKLLEVSLAVQNNPAVKKLLYEKLAKFYPRCEPPKYIPLTFIKDESELEKKLGEYVIPLLKRGIPATFSNVKPLYQKRSGVVPRLLERVVGKYLDSLDAGENPIQYIWTCYYLSQHYLFAKDYTNASKYIELAITHTPTLVEFYILKARIAKHNGLLDDAAAVMEEARKLDLQDRFINSKTVKYFLRANNIDKAIEIASLFTKNDNSVNGVKDLHLVEASWFIVEQGEAYYRLYLEAVKKLDDFKNDSSNETEESAGELRELQWLVSKYRGLSLKRFTAISKFYKQFEDDQLDFHSYCMRKGTPRAYLDMLSWGKTLYTKPMYVRAMRFAARIYFELEDEAKRRRIAAGGASEEENGTVQANNKKAKKEVSSVKKRREEERRQVLAYSEDQDDDPFGSKLLATATPLDSFAQEFYNAYNEEVRDDERDPVVDFEFHYRTGKLALCLGALNRCAKRQGADSALCGAMLLTLLNATRDAMPYEPIAKKVALAGLEADYKDLLPADGSDSTEVFQERYSKQTRLPTPLLFMYHHGEVFDQEKVKPMILDSLAHCEPYIKNAILQYEL
ncbi:peptide alpha-N-acetyltransferase complex A subunit NAT1 KNAG_0K01780 [Huiozyma naganishii CBS 8797]|uniref:N-terminal acetyltransferase A complex subunit NAT1 n=1 Tax=Huiozyma naganishii (strain ATCC MYA-139 / BCRC 22969 / CBS 8797 / KCTC 17520 / NBRC 10181 / NCYC 3082 / Yp74L-3) TaxID=1071383 RepID=J7RRR4_HUIN7|nr:hypothetical protein KNAG_0K01780 [Kazachstania naganishii CBS 8797]CCK72543.1 hypothetical protein KNAG_0K01780 [Kazachstania naganishii CBS 8797]